MDDNPYRSPTADHARSQRNEDEPKTAPRSSARPAFLIAGGTAMTLHGILVATSGGAYTPLGTVELLGGVALMFHASRLR